MKNKNSNNDKMLKRQSKNTLHAMHNFKSSRMMKWLVLFGRTAGFGAFVFFDVYFATILVFEIVRIIAASAVIALSEGPFYMCAPWLAVCLFAVRVIAWAFIRALAWGKKFFFGNKVKKPDSWGAATPPIGKAVMTCREEIKEVN